MKSKYFVDSHKNSYNYVINNSTFFSYHNENPYDKGLLPFLTSAAKEFLIEVVHEFTDNDKDVNWTLVADKFNRSNFSTQSVQPMECLMAYRNVLNPEINSGPWTSEEEIHLLELINTKYSCHNWAAISNELGTNRTPLSCLKHYQQTLNIKHINSNPWDEEELNILEKAVELYGEENWQHVANSLPSRTAIQCINKWKKMKIDLQTTSKGDWTDHEERLLFLAAIAYQIPCVNDYKKSIDLSKIEQTLESDADMDNSIEEMDVNTDSNEIPSKTISTWTWQKIANLLPGRSAASCREKWCNQTDPFLKRGPFTQEEDELLLYLARKLPERQWAKISRFVMGRTDVMVSMRNTKLLGDPHKDLRSHTKRLLPRKYSRKRAEAKIRPEQFASILRVSVPTVLSSNNGSDDEKEMEEES